MGVIIFVFKIIRAKIYLVPSIHHCIKTLHICLIFTVYLFLNIKRRLRKVE